MLQNSENVFSLTDNAQLMLSMDYSLDPFSIALVTDCPQWRASRTLTFDEIFHSSTHEDTSNPLARPVLA